MTAKHSIHVAPQNCRYLVKAGGPFLNTVYAAQKSNKLNQAARTKFPDTFPEGIDLSKITPAVGLVVPATCM